MVLMVTGGVLGGVGGRSINNKMSTDDGIYVYTFSMHLS